ncbi:MAG: hypothetical protein VYC39_17625 [Myxococcota bacterium]|nr:hypothetical protein [Myxococcota bacterium]
MRYVQVLKIALLSLFVAGFIGCKDDGDGDNMMNGPADSGIQMCPTGKTGANCEECIDPLKTGTNCDECVDPKKTGSDCSRCKDPDAIGDDCEIPCVRDQDCESGFVCQLDISPRMCVKGTDCSTNPNICDSCFTLTGQQIECGHGFHIQAYCSAEHGNVCVRDLSACEPCQTDAECGELSILLGGAENKCIEYPDGNKYCGRASTGAACPRGFVANDQNQCIRTAGCPARTVVCPEGMTGQACTGTDQICPGVECPGTEGAKCSNNEVPGAMGVCVNYCSTNADCPAATPICNVNSGICIAGCTKDSCAGNEVCHADGFCGPPCDENTFCEMETKFGDDYYCNKPGQPPPRIFKGYYDRNSCQRKGCEKPEDCGSAGRVCDPKQTPYPACVEGCYTAGDCLSGYICRDPGPGGPKPSYSRAECRGLAEKGSDEDVGVCCNPGCTNRNLQCGFNQFCCGEEGSPYEDPTTCFTKSSTGTRQAEPGECFDIQPGPGNMIGAATDSPWCVQCADNPDCNSNFTFGFNSDPDIDGGAPFQEQEWCQPVAMGGPNFCTVTCNPNNKEGGTAGCPRLWNCVPNTPPCFQDADCNGLECIGEDTSQDPPIPGQCLCGMGGQVTAACPQSYSQLPDAVERPRCVELGANGEMFCLSNYHCAPPQLSQDAQGNANYPAACLQ